MNKISVDVHWPSDYPSPGHPYYVPVTLNGGVALICDRADAPKVLEYAIKVYQERVDETSRR